MTPKPARALAWLTFAVGIVVSVLGNIGHAASDGMQSGEWAGAAFWPLALLLSIEIIVRVRWQPEKRWTIARFAGLLVVSIVSAILSYLHLRSLLIFWNYGTFQGTIGPLAVDGLMLIAASALLSISHEKPEAVAPAPVLEMINETEQVFGKEQFISQQLGHLTGVGSLKQERTIEETNAFVAEHIRVGDTSRVEATQQEADAVAEAEYFTDLDASEDVDGPELMAEPKPEESKLHVVKSVSTDDAEEAARQAWINSGKTLSSAQVAELAGISKSTAHRRITRQWSSQR